MPGIRLSTCSRDVRSEHALNRYTREVDRVGMPPSIMQPLRGLDSLPACLSIALGGDLQCSAPLNENPDAVTP